MKDYDPDDPAQQAFDRAARGESTGPPPDDGGPSGCAIAVGFVMVCFLVLLGTCAL